MLIFVGCMYEILYLRKERNTILKNSNDEILALKLLLKLRSSVAGLAVKAEAVRVEKSGC